MASALQLDQFLCFSVYSTEHVFNQFYRPLLEEIGLTYSQYLVMVSLWSRDDRIVKEIGEVLALESNTLTPLLKRLEALGLITRTRDAENERQLRIRLTDKGRALRERAESIPVCVTAALGLSPEELIELRGKLRLVQQRLRDSVGRQGPARAQAPA